MIFSPRLRRMVLSLGAVLVVGIAVSDSTSRAEEPAPSAAPLALSAHVSPTRLEEGGTLTFEAVFRNTGDAALPLFVPHLAREDRFPRWRFRHEDGTVWVPSREPVAAKPPVGIQGKVDALAPGARRRFRYQLATFLRVDPQTGTALWADPLPLPAGTWKVQCSWTQADETVPFLSDGAEGPSTKRIPGLATGTLQAAERTLVVAPRKTPHLHIEAPAHFVAGKAFRLRLVLRNPSPRPLDANTAFEIHVGRKGKRTGVIHVRHARRPVLHQPHARLDPLPLVVRAGQEHLMGASLDDLQVTPAGGGAPVPFHAFVDGCWFTLQARNVHGGVESNVLIRQAVPAED